MKKLVKSAMADIADDLEQLGKQKSSKSLKKTKRSVETDLLVGSTVRSAESSKTKDQIGQKDSQIITEPIVKALSGETKNVDKLLRRENTEKSNRKVKIIKECSVNNYVGMSSASLDFVNASANGTFNKKKRRQIVQEVIAWIPSDPATTASIQQGNTKPVFVVNDANLDHKMSSCEPGTSATPGPRKILPYPKYPPVSPFGKCKECGGVKNKSLTFKIPSSGKPCNNADRHIFVRNNKVLTDASSYGTSPGMEIVKSELEMMQETIVELSRQVDEMKSREKALMDNYINVIKDFQQNQDSAVQKASKEIKETLKESLTESQVQLLLKEKGRINWTNQDIDNALILFRISRPAYNFVRNTMKIPLPAQGSIRGYSLRCKKNFLNRINQICGKEKSKQGSLAFADEERLKNETVMEIDGLRGDAEDVRVYQTNLNAT